MKQSGGVAGGRKPLASVPKPHGPATRQSSIRQRLAARRHRRKGELRRSSIRRFPSVFLDFHCTARTLPVSSISSPKITDAGIKESKNTEKDCSCLRVEAARGF